jgi:hypothetical protein
MDGTLALAMKGTFSAWSLQNSSSFGALLGSLGDMAFRGKVRVRPLDAARGENEVWDQSLFWATRPVPHLA